MTEVSLVLLGLSLAATATFFGVALVVLCLLAIHPTPEHALHAIDAQHQPARKGAAPTEAPLQRVDQVVDLARSAGLRHEAGGRQKVAAAGVL